MTENESLEQLVARKDKFQHQLKNLTNTMTEISDVFNSLKNELNDINKKIGQYKLTLKKDITVTDHAVLRYIERSKKFVTSEGDPINIDQIRSSLLTDEVKKYHSVLGNGIYPLENEKVSVVIKDNTIVTVTVKG